MSVPILRWKSVFSLFLSRNIQTGIFHQQMFQIHSDPITPNKEQIFR